MEWEEEVGVLRIHGVERWDLPASSRLTSCRSSIVLDAAGMGAGNRKSGIGRLGERGHLNLRKGEIELVCALSHWRLHRVSGPLYQDHHGASTGMRAVARGCGWGRLKLIPIGTKCQ